MASAETVSAVSESLDKLKMSVMDNMEARTEVILRPLIGAWLDEHLVERLVRDEIERIAKQTEENEAEL